MLVEVVAHKGSVPRETGTRMLVSADEVVGTIGGGHLELQAIARARQALGVPGAPGAPAVRAQPRTSAGPVPDPEPTDPSQPVVQTELFGQVEHIALGPSLGQCCGGALTLRYVPLAGAAPAAWVAPAPRFFLQLYGAGHVGRAIVALLAGLPCRVQWVDEREAEFPAGPTPPHIERVCVEPVEAEVALAPPGAFYLVLTHSHDLDLALAQAILKRGDFGFFGLIGSKTKRARFQHRLAERGFDAGHIARMTCPIGVPGIEGKEPEVIAVAVVAQLLQAASV